MTNEPPHITESHLINRFGFLFRYECSLISAPNFFFSLCHSSLWWKSTDCNHFTGSHESQHKPHYHTRSGERFIFSPFFSLSTRGRGKQTQPITLPQVTSAFTCGRFERGLQIGGRRDLNIDLCFISGVFHQLPIKVYFPV